MFWDFSRGGAIVYEDLCMLVARWNVVLAGLESPPFLEKCREIEAFWCNSVKLCQDFVKQCHRRGSMCVSSL